MDTYIDPNCQYFNILTICVTFTVILLILSSVFILIYSIRTKKMLWRMKHQELLMNAKIDETIPELLEMFINETFIDYLTLSYGTTQMPNEFINDEMEAKIRQDLSTHVQERVSETLLDKLSVYYSLQHIGSTIGNKIYIVVMSYVINTNHQLAIDISNIPDETVLN